MEVKKLIIEEIEQYSDGIWKILCDADRDFIPPLSARETTTDSVLQGGNEGPTKKPVTYFKGLKT